MSPTVVSSTLPADETRTLGSGWSRGAVEDGDLVTVWSSVVGGDSHSRTMVTLGEMIVHGPDSGLDEGLGSLPTPVCGRGL